MPQNRKYSTKGTDYTPGTRLEITARKKAGAKLVKSGKQFKDKNIVPAIEESLREEDEIV